MQKLQTKFKKIFEKLLNQYGQTIYINNKPATAIYTSNQTNLPIEEIGIIPTIQTTIYLPIDTQVNQTDQITIQDKTYKIQSIKNYYKILQIITLEETEIE